MLNFLTNLGMSKTKPTPVPLLPGVNYSKFYRDPLQDQNKYRRLMGRLLYLNFTRPDITFAVNHLSQFMHMPCEVYLEGVMHILAYLKGTIHHSLYCDSNSFSKLKCFEGYGVFFR